MRWVLIAPALLALTACGTPQQQCIDQTSQDLIVLDRLIAQTQGNLARGFAYVPTVQSVPVFQPCFGPPSGAYFYGGPLTCSGNWNQTVLRPSAIDLNAEAAKLATMQKKRDQLAHQLAPAVAECKARYPQ